MTVTLSEGEVYRLYDSETSAEDLLNNEGITVTDSLSMLTGRTEKIELSMPAVVADSNPENHIRKQCPGGGDCIRRRYSDGGLLVPEKRKSPHS